MIQLSLTAALALYGGLILTGALALWLYAEVSTHRRYTVLERQHLWRCPYCAYVYLDQDAVQVSECPRCGSLNTSETPRRHTQDHDTATGPEGARRNPSRRKRPGAKRRGPRRKR